MFPGGGKSANVPHNKAHKSTNISISYVERGESEEEHLLQFGWEAEQGDGSIHNTEENTLLLFGLIRKLKRM